MTIGNWQRANLLIRYHEFAISLLSAFWGAVSVGAAEIDTAAGSRQEPAPKIKKMVEALASYNRTPALTGASPSTKACFDSTYDWLDQDRVKRAIDFLSDHADEGWSCLLKHSDDQRYSITWQFKEDARNVCVADICQDIVCGALIAGYFKCLPEAARHAKAGWSPDAPGDLPDDQLRAWCRERKDKKLYELQVEMCQWAVEKIQQSNHSRDAPAIEAIQKNIAFLRKYQKALHPIHLAHRSKHVTYYR